MLHKIYLEFRQWDENNNNNNSNTTTWPQCQNWFKTPQSSLQHDKWIRVTINARRLNNGLFQWSSKINYQNELGFWGWREKEAKILKVPSWSLEKKDSS